MDMLLYSISRNCHFYTLSAIQFLYYIDIIVLETSQEVDHRVEWKNLQEEMLRSYLATAESDLKAKQELVDIKQHRLSLAQHDLNHLNTTLSTLSTSTTSRKSPF
jgi:hypothetical protein